MSNDLISRSELKKNLDLKFSFGLENKIKLFDEIDNMQTAYDIDKFADRLKEKISNNIMTQTFGLRGKDIFYLIDETLNELKDGVENE